MILLTDPNKPSHEGFSYAMPQGREVWQVWRAAAARCNSYVMGIAMAYRLDGSGKKDLILILPDESHSDDDIETAAAHLRVMEKFEGSIFVMRPEPERPKRDMHLAALAGAEIEEMGASMGHGRG